MLLVVVMWSLTVGKSLFKVWTHRTVEVDNVPDVSAKQTRIADESHVDQVCLQTCPPDP